MRGLPVNISPVTDAVGAAHSAFAKVVVAWLTLRCVRQELGGNAACVVEDYREGELEAIVPKLIFGAFYQSGQSCISVQRLLIRQAGSPALHVLRKNK